MLYITTVYVFFCFGGGKPSLKIVGFTANKKKMKLYAGVLVCCLVGVAIGCSGDWSELRHEFEDFKADVEMVVRTMHGYMATHGDRNTTSSEEDVVEMPEVSNPKEQGMMFNAIVLAISLTHKASMKAMYYEGGELQDAWQLLDSTERVIARSFYRAQRIGFTFKK